MLIQKLKYWIKNFIGKFKQNYSLSDIQKTNMFFFLYNLKALKSRLYKYLMYIKDTKNIKKYQAYLENYEYFHEIDEEVLLNIYKKYNINAKKLFFAMIDICGIRLWKTIENEIDFNIDIINKYSEKYIDLFDS